MASILKLRKIYADGHIEIEVIGPNNNASINKGMDIIQTEIVFASSPEQLIRMEMYCEEDGAVLH